MPPMLARKTAGQTRELAVALLRVCGRARGSEPRDLRPRCDTKKPAFAASHTGSPARQSALASLKKAAREAFDILTETSNRDDARVVPDSKVNDLVKKVDTDLAAQRPVPAAEE